jgi:aspartyl-tRNA(Asn)/glutamyl-tRNA(Gln) amidotransferase subunit B
VIELVAKLRANNVKIENVDPATLDHLISLIKLIKQQRINGKQAKVIFEKVYNEKVDPLQIVETLNVQQISDDNHLKTILEKLIADNQTVIKDYPTRPERVEKFLLGGLMKETKGQANPVLAKKILDELLKGQK